MSINPEDSLHVLLAGLGPWFSPDVPVRDAGAGSSQMSPLPILHDPCHTVEAEGSESNYFRRKTQRMPHRSEALV